MHNFDPQSFDINLEEISKIEGAATLKIKVRGGEVRDLRFKISEWKRFYTQAIRGKPYTAIPQLVARICGTCSNAHLLCSIEAIEKALNITPSAQTMLLRKLLYYGLIIRDHALHLYIFALPSLLGRESILDFDDDNEVEHKFLHDAFAVKEVGNRLSLTVGGRSVHAPYPTVGGFLKLPRLDELKTLIPRLAAARTKVLELIEFLAQKEVNYDFDLPLIFSGLDSPDFSFLEGEIKTSAGQKIPESNLGQHLEAVIIPYSQARGFKFDGQFLLVGALARLNVARQRLNPRTKKSISSHLKRFPSKNFFDNNLAQAIEILQAIDASYETITKFKNLSSEENTVPKASAKDVSSTSGVGVIEAPRGTLYYHLQFDDQGRVKNGEIIVPTGQNQVVMERAIYLLVQHRLGKGAQQQEIVAAVEDLIRSFDPCMSCAAHFLRVDWC